MAPHRLLSCLVIPIASIVQAQYCSPTFANGCFNWYNQQVTIGDIDLPIGSAECGTSDHTALSTVMEPGVAEPMTVISGVWTGCAVWVDLNNNMTFEDSENLFHNYVGGDPSFTYTFDLTLPPGTPDGNYRMRVIAPWGSDGFTPGSSNGFGPCGSYQYGNFDDFTLTVGTGTGEASHDAYPVRIRPNPTMDQVSISSADGRPIQRILVVGADGRTVLNTPAALNSGTTGVDLSALPAGTYAITLVDGAGTRTVRVMKL